MTLFIRFRSLACGTAIALSSALLGCGISATSKPVITGTAFSGRIKGGQQPISGASVFLYAAGSSSPGAGAVNLLKSQVFSDAQGNFSITADYTCPSASTQVYVVSQGGNPGLSGVNDNRAILLAAALGDCGALSAPSYFINVNEVTTAAAAWALAPFLSSGGIVGASSTNATGLRNAFANANKLVNIATGNAGGPGLSAGTTIEAAKLYTLANALSACVNSDGTTACNPLFQAGTVGTSVPSNTLDTAQNIVMNPGSNVLAIFNLAPSSAPFQPALATAPHDWTMSITFTGGGLNSPTDLAADSKGDIWAANYSGASVTELLPDGSIQNLADTSLRESYGIAVDGQDNVWITNEQSPFSVNNGNGSITEFGASATVLSGSGFSSGGIYYPYAIAADTDGSIWVADYGRSGATHLASDGSSLSGASGYASDSNLPDPDSVALDANHNAWFGAETMATQVTSTGVITPHSCCHYGTGIAVDQTGNIWLADYSGSSLVELDTHGAPLQTLTGIGGIYYPGALAVDGKGNVWTANYHGDTISVISGASSGSTSTALSPASGYGIDAGLGLPRGIALDSTGSVWVTNYALNSVTQFVGIASPIATPLLGPPKQP